MLEEADRKALVEAITQAGVKPGLIVLDTLARCYGGGDENSTKDMNTFVTNCDLLRESFPDTTILVVHHTGKDTARGLRGSSAFNGALDIAFEMNRPHLDLPPAFLKNAKPHKDSRMVPRIDLRLDEVPLADDKTSLIVRMLNTSEKTEDILDEDLRSDEARRKQTAACNQTWRVLHKNFPNGAKNATWYEASRKGRPLGKSTFQRHVQKLREAGWVRQRGIFTSRLTRGRTELPARRTIPMGPMGRTMLPRPEGWRGRVAGTRARTAEFGHFNWDAWFALGPFAFMRCLTPRFSSWSHVDQFSHLFTRGYGSLTSLILRST
jgi:hypothetical protein